MRGKIKVKKKKNREKTEEKGGKKKKIVENWEWRRENYSRNWR